MRLSVAARVLHRHPVRRRGIDQRILVEVAQIDSFIATLGTGTILYALALWHTDGRQVIGDLRRASSISTYQCSACRCRRLCTAARGSTLDRHRENAARPAYLRHRCKRKGGGAQRHSGSQTRHRRVRRVWAAGRLHGCVLAAKLQIGQANVGSTTCCPRLSGPFSGRPRSGPDASTCGARSSAS